MQLMGWTRASTSCFHPSSDTRSVELTEAFQSAHLSSLLKLFKADHAFLCLSFFVKAVLLGRVINQHAVPRRIGP
jgi:hypothetical protein